MERIYTPTTTNGPLICATPPWTQLYGFHKTTQDPDLCEFQHKHFKRDNPGLLHNIKRKVPPSEALCFER